MNKKILVFIICILSLVLVGCKKSEPVKEKSEPVKETTPVDTKTPDETVKTPTPTPIPTPTPTPTPIPTPTPTEVVTPEEVLERLMEEAKKYQESKNGLLQVELKNKEETRTILLVYNYNGEKLESFGYVITGDKETHIYLKSNYIYTLIDGVKSVEAFNNSSNVLISDAIENFFIMVNELINNELLEEDVLDLDKVILVENEDAILSCTFNFSSDVMCKITFGGLSKQDINYPSDLSSYGE